MASLPQVLLCAVTAALFWTALGYPIARTVVPATWSALAAAPALGWAVSSAAALPLFLLIGLTSSTVAALAAGALLASILATPRWGDRRPGLGGPPVPAWAFVLAGLAACAPAVAIMPKFVADGVILAAPAFDHSKVALVDEIARLGLPPGNPTFGEAGQPSRLAYYYLWHLSAAMLALPLGASGWEADVALTWFTAFSSLLLAMGMAVWASGRPAAAPWVAVLSLAGSARPLLSTTVGPETAERLLPPHRGLAGWLVQATWAPQHLASACCVVLAVVLAVRLADGLGRRWIVPILGLVVAAGCQSSTWVGGVAFALVAVPVGLLLLLRLEPGRRLPFLIDGALAAALALALALPSLGEQYAANAARGGGAPVALWPYEVLGPCVPEGFRRWLDLPAYWLLLLPLDLPAVYPIGAVGLAAAVAVARRGEFTGRGRLTGALALLALASFVVTWLLVSTVLNNDLGWRAILPGVLVLTASAAAALARVFAGRRRMVAAAALALAALGAPDGLRFVAGNVAGRPTPAAAAFAWTPGLWEAVRRHSAPADRVANNPLFLADLTPWPVNASWALLADRRSCFGSWAHVRAFTPLSTPRVHELEALFARVFAGDGSPEEVRELATRYDCRLVALTATDGGWERDPFAASPAYRLVDETPGRWRLYAATLPAP